MKNMRNIKDVARSIFGQGGFEIINVETCPRCGVEIKTIRMVILGGPEKGQEQISKTECHCKLAADAVNAAKRSKFAYYKQFWTINESLDEASLDNFQTTSTNQGMALNKCFDFIDRLVDGKKPARMFFYGSPGLGKSHLALSVCRYVEEELNKTSLFIEMPTLKDVLKASFSKESDYTSHEIMRALSEVDLLVLDDLGAEGITDWTKEIVFTILNSRMNKSLLVTSNLGLQEIFSQYGDKHVDRLLQGMEKSDVFKFEGKYSHRLKDFLGDGWE